LINLHIYLLFNSYHFHYYLALVPDFDEETLSNEMPGSYKTSSTFNPIQAASSTTTSDNFSAPPSNDNSNDYNSGTTTSIPNSGLKTIAESDFDDEL